MINEDWEHDFYDFMRQTRVVSDDTIDTYLKDVKRIAELFGEDVLHLVKDQESYEQTIGRIQGNANWSTKAKSNYKTAFNRLWSYSKCLLTERDGRSSISQDGEGSHSSTTEKKSNLSIMDEVNRQEEYAREKEDSVCRLIFGLISAYVLAMPAILVNARLTACALVIAAISEIAGFASLFSFIPLLRRPCRHARTIGAYGEELVFENKSFGWIHPENWSRVECLALVFVAILVGISIIGFMVAIIVNRLAQ